MSCLIQIGCCVGDEYIFKLIHNNKINTCIFIDANVSALEKCRENQDDFFRDKNVDWDVKFEYINCAISDSKLDELELNIPTGDIHSSHSSIFSDFPTIFDAKNGFDAVKVKNFSINDIFENYGLTLIDYLFIDVEGCDKGIVSNINLNKYNILNIKFEFTHWDGWQGFNSEHLRHVIFFLLMNKYKVYQSSATDLTATKLQNWVQNYDDENKFLNGVT